MARLVILASGRTYASEANAVAAVSKRFGDDLDGLRYFITQDAGGRFFPVFIGNSAVEAGVHFHFPVVA